MCGILGEFSLRNPLSSQEAFLKLNRRSAKRGPDYTGYPRVDDCCQLAHTRLSILDLSENANQPIARPLGRYHLVFNGEIYSHEDIRRRLPAGFYPLKGIVVQYFMALLANSSWKNNQQISFFAYL